MKAPRFLVEHGTRLEPRLRELLRAKGEALSRLPLPFPADVLEQYVLRGGKRLRGALVELAGGTLDASVGVELLHAYLLIHDDFMDRDEVRRGGPTVHVALGGDHRAASVAVLLGSLCEAWAYELILAAPNGLAAAQELTRALQEVIVGQTLDLLAPGRDLDARGILEIERLKTGSYTFELPLRLGAIVSGKPKDAFDAYAKPLGQAFQIADDLLGTFGDPEVTGKPNASDLREGKRTLLVARALEGARGAAVRALLGKPDRVDDLRELLRESGAADAARREAERLRDEAIAALPRLPEETRGPLREIALYAVGRDR